MFLLFISYVKARCVVDASCLCLPVAATVFCNSRRQSQNFRDHLERKLNEMKLNVDIIHINGSLHKTDKFWRIRLFCNEGHIREADLRLLVTTNAANVGIDKYRKRLARETLANNMARNHVIYK